MMRFHGSTLGALALLLAGVTPLRADPPVRVARLSYLEGSVSMRAATAADDDWTQAVLNYPFTSGDNLWTDSASRAELHIGSMALQLAPMTALQMVALDDDRLQARVTEGTVEVRVRELDANDLVELDTPAGTVTLVQPGLYRLDVSPDGDTTTITVRSGAANIATASQTFAVRAGQSGVVSGADRPLYDLQPAEPPDDFDQWAAARDDRDDRSVSAQYVSREMTGYEDLDAYGEWRVVPDYGRVWIPTRVAAGWAPYRFGHWAWVQPWGWTWIDNEPWGFAPFHYGRWAYYGGAWVWAPGAIVARPVYAPALVAFVGGPHFSLTVGMGGGVAWFPLAPGEVYVPAYHVSDRYARNINITNVNVTNVNITRVNVTNVRYRNESIAGAVTAVPHDVFVGAQPVARHAVAVRPHDLETAEIIGHAPSDITPTRQSIGGRAFVGRAAPRPPVAVVSRPVVARAARTETPQVVRREPARVNSEIRAPVPDAPRAPQSRVAEPAPRADAPARPWTSRAATDRPEPVRAPVDARVARPMAPPREITPPRTPVREMPNDRVQQPAHEAPNVQRAVPQPREERPVQQVRPTQQVRPVQQARPVQEARPNLQARAAPRAPATERGRVAEPSRPERRPVADNARARRGPNHG